MEGQASAWPINYSALQKQGPPLITRGYVNPRYFSEFLDILGKKMLPKMLLSFNMRCGMGVLELEFILNKPPI